MRIASPLPRTFGKDCLNGESQNESMATRSQKKAANNLRAWREFRELTQDELAAKIGTAGNVISLLEAGERRLSDKWLLKLAPALGTSAGFLLDYDPNDIDAAFIDAAMSVPKERRAQALQILRTFKAGAAS